MQCSTGSDFVAKVCMVLGAKDAYAVLAGYDAHEVVKVECNDGTTFTTESGFGSLAVFDEDTVKANKPDLSTLN